MWTLYYVVSFIWRFFYSAYIPELFFARERSGRPPSAASAYLLDLSLGWQDAYSAWTVVLVAATLAIATLTVVSARADVYSKVIFSAYCGLLLLATIALLFSRWALA